HQRPYRMIVLLGLVVAVDLIVVAGAVAGVDPLVETAVDVLQTALRVTRQQRHLHPMGQQQVREIVASPDLDPRAHGAILSCRGDTGERSRDLAAPTMPRRRRRRDALGGLRRRLAHAVRLNTRLKYGSARDGGWPAACRARTAATKTGMSARRIRERAVPRKN